MSAEPQTDAESLGKVLAAVEGRRPGVPDPWTVELYRAHVRVTSGDGGGVVIDRKTFVLNASVVPRSKDAYLYIRKPTKISLLLDNEALAMVRAWVGVDLPRWMQADLQRRAKSALISAAGLGGLGMLFSDGFLMVVGVFLVVLGMILWSVLSRRLFLVEVGGLAAIGLVLTVDMMFGHGGMWLLVLFPMLYFSGAAGVRLHRFYADVQSPK